MPLPRLAISGTVSCASSSGAPMPWPHLFAQPPSLHGVPAVPEWIIPKTPLPLGHVLAAGAARRRIWGHESREGSPLRIIAWTLMFNHLSSQLGAYLGMPSRGEPQLPPMAKLPAEHSLAQNAQRPSHIRRLDSDAPGWSNEPDSCAMMRAMRRLSHEAPRKPCVALKTAALSSTSSPREHEDLQRS